MKQFIREHYALLLLIVVCIAANIGSVINYPALAALLLCLLLLFSRNRLLGIGLGIGSACVAVGLLLAACSEYQEFPAQAPKAVLLLVAGAALSTLLFLLAIRLLRQYGKRAI